MSFESFCSAARLCTLIFSWCITTELLLWAVFIIGINFGSEGLDFSSELALRKAATYTLIIAIIFGAGALLFGGIAAGWALTEAVAAKANAATL